MAKRIINDSTLDAIADAIRAKTGDSGTMTPLEMPDEIANIPSGGGDNTLKSLIDGTATGAITISGYEDLGYATFSLGINYNAVTELHFPDTKYLTADAYNYRLYCGIRDLTNSSTLTVLDAPKCERICITNGAQNANDNRFKSLLTLNLPKCKELYGCLRGCKLSSVRLPVIEQMSPSMFRNSTSLVTVDLGNSQLQAPANTTILQANVLYGCSTLDALVLRYPNIVLLGSTGNIGSTAISSGNGYIYVPRSLISSYEGATNWSTFTGQFRAIEDYTNDHTIDGTFVHP